MKMKLAKKLRKLLKIKMTIFKMIKIQNVIVSMKINQLF
jgi:hypothetical protein